LLHQRQRHALRVVGDRPPLWPPRRRDPSAQVGDLLLRKTDAERTDRGIAGHGGLILGTRAGCYVGHLRPPFIGWKRPKLASPASLAVGVSMRCSASLHTARTRIRLVDSRTGQSWNRANGRRRSASRGLAAARAGGPPPTSES